MVDQSVQNAIEDFRGRPRPVLLRCGVQHYPWGGFDFIAGLLGVENRQRRPFAELWVGAHPDLPSAAIIGDVDVPLPVLVEGAAEKILGRDVASRFDRRLPFLLKVLSAAQPLSIQAHPNAQQAREGFEREHSLGISLDDPRRNYRDDQHKPELIVALTDFYALRGFRALDEIGACLAAVPELRELAGDYRPTRDSLVALYTRVMQMEQREVDDMLTPFIRRLNEEGARDGFSKQQPEYWAIRADAVFSRNGHRDRGLFSIFLLNLVRLAPGEAMYLPAGELHAYLEGTGIEVMASSNNVLRGGLTPKHVDVDELLRILSFTTGVPEVIEPPPTQAGQTEYDTPAAEFVLARLRVTCQRPQRRGRQPAVHLGIVTEGTAHISTPAGDRLDLTRGDAFLVPQGLAYEIVCNTDAVIFEVSVPP